LTGSGAVPAPTLPAAPDDREIGTASRIGWGLQLLLGASLAVTICSALALVDDHGRAYGLALLLTVLATVCAFALRGSSTRLAVTCGALAIALIYGVLATRLGWLLALVIYLACVALLCAPTVLSRRTGRLLVPVAATVALTAAASAFTFYARPSPFVLGDEPTAWLRLPSGQSAPPVEFVVVYTFHGCSQPVTINFSYFGNRLHSAQAVTSTSNAGLLSNLSYSAHGYAVGPDILDPNAPFGGSGPQTDPALQVRPRGFIGSCYLDLAQFIGPWAGVKNQKTSVSAVPLSEGANLVVLNGASLSVLSGESPTRSGDPSTWDCPASAEQGSYQTLCSAILMVTDSWYQTWQNLMLLFIGALFAGVIALAGRAIAGLGWFAIERTPGKSD
jgi:hypothetical protein